MSGELPEMLNYQGWLKDSLLDSKDLYRICKSLREMDSHFWGIIPGLYPLSVPPLRSLLVGSWWSPWYSTFRTTYILLSGTFRGHTVPALKSAPLSKNSTGEGHSQVDDSWQHLCLHQTKKDGFRTPVLSLHSLNFISFFPQRDVAVGILACFRLRWLLGALSAGPRCWFVKCPSSKKLPELETYRGNVRQLLKGGSVSVHSARLAWMPRLNWVWAEMANVNDNTVSPIHIEAKLWGGTDYFQWGAWAEVVRKIDSIV